MFALIVVICVVSILGYWLFKNQAYGVLSLVVVTAFMAFEGMKAYWSVDLVVKPMVIAAASKAY